MTLLEKFKKDHPNAPYIDKSPKCCPGHLGYIGEGCAGGECVACWNREYEGEETPVKTVEESEKLSDIIADVHHGLINRGFNEGYAEKAILGLIDRGYFDK